MKAKFTYANIIIEYTDETGKLHTPTEETTNHILNVIGRELAQMELVIAEQANDLMAENPKAFSVLPLMPHARGNINLQ